MMTSVLPISNQTAQYGGPQPHTLMLRRGAIQSNNHVNLPHSSQTPSKDLYIVALSSSDQHRLVQYQVASTASTNVSTTSKSPQTLVLTNSYGSGTSQGNAAAGASSSALKQALSSTATGHISGTASPTQAERRNVAEILASLSGLMPEPPSSGAIISTPTTTPRVVTTAGSSLQVFPASKAGLTPSSVALTGSSTTSSNLVIEPIPLCNTVAKKSPSTPTLASTTSSGITITAFKSKPTFVQSNLGSALVTASAKTVTSTKGNVRSTATILNSSNTTGQSIITSANDSSPSTATRVVRVLQSATGSTSRQVIHQSGGGGLTVSSTPVVIARKSSAAPAPVISTTTTTSTPVPTTITSSLASSSGQARSRKQVLIPVDLLSRMEEQDSDDKIIASTESESRPFNIGKATPVTDDESSVAKRIKRRRHSSAATAAEETDANDTPHPVGEESKQAVKTSEASGMLPISIESEIRPSGEYEPDILEEDLDDLEYVPYTSRKSKTKRSTHTKGGRTGK